MAEGMKDGFAPNIIRKVAEMYEKLAKRAEAKTG